jgi:hypothetical protein
MMLAWLSASLITASCSSSKRLEETAVCVETGRIEDRVVHPQKRREPRLELLVHGLGAADEAHRGHAIPVPVDRAMRRLAESRMIGEPEIVVCAKVDELAAVGEAHDWLLRRAQHALGLEEPLLAQTPGLGRQTVEKRLVQSGFPFKAAIIGAL